MKTQVTLKDFSCFSSDMPRSTHDLYLFSELKEPGNKNIALSYLPSYWLVAKTETTAGLNRAQNIQRIRQEALPHYHSLHSWSQQHLTACEPCGMAMHNHPPKQTIPLCLHCLPSTTASFCSLQFSMIVTTPEQQSLTPPPEAFPFSTTASWCFCRTDQSLCLYICSLSYCLLH